MHLIEDDLVGVVDTPKSCNERQDRGDGQGELVFPLRCGSFLAGLYDGIEEVVSLVCCFTVGFCLFFLGPSVSQGRIGTRHVVGCVTEKGGYEAAFGFSMTIPQTHANTIFVPSLVDLLTSHAIISKIEN